jgi:hypothetical protein
MNFANAFHQDVRRQAMRCNTGVRTGNKTFDVLINAAGRAGR